MRLSARRIISEDRGSNACISLSTMLATSSVLEILGACLSEPFRTNICSGADSIDLPSYNMNSLDPGWTVFRFV